MVTESSSIGRGGLSCWKLVFFRKKSKALHHEIRMDVFGEGSNVTQQQICKMPSVIAKKIKGNELLDSQEQKPANNGGCS